LPCDGVTIPMLPFDEQLEYKAWAGVKAPELRGPMLELGPLR
jgi:hypothetical protein